jgi:histidinol dehydrogenase
VLRLNRDLNAIKNRKAEADESIISSVQAIISDVKKNGDEAVRRYAKKFDGFDEAVFLVSDEEICAAVERGKNGDFMRILQRTKEQLEFFHKNQAEKSWSVFKDNGAMMGQIVRPIERVAIYAPAGTAVLTSSFMMCAVPAKLAGVEDIVVFSPAKADGKIADELLQAAFICGIKKIYKLGSAWAIAAAAYGTQSIPKTDKIVGPGNSFVVTAKRLVYGDVDIDLIAGPSDILIIADESANAKYIAADLLSQAEHGVDSSAILVTTNEKIIPQVEAELERQLSYLKRADIARKALEDYGAGVFVPTLEEAFAISNDMAPEHLEILTADPISHLPKVKNAGSIFLGENTPEPVADYMSGTNHVLPTGGRARFSSGLGVYSFLKYSAYSYYPHAALAELKDDVSAFAMREGLDAHANSVKVRFE